MLCDDAFEVVAPYELEERLLDRWLLYG